MYQDIYNDLITEARKLLDIAGLLETQKNLIEQLKQKSLQSTGGLIYHITKLSKTHWKIIVEREGIK